MPESTRFDCETLLNQRNPLFYQCLLYFKMIRVGSTEAGALYRRPTPARVLSQTERLNGPAPLTHHDGGPRCQIHYRSGLEAT